jgi:hypothetical protein
LAKEKQLDQLYSLEVSAENDSQFFLTDPV